jgi:hypothetical protein
MPNAFALCASSILTPRAQIRHRPEKQTARQSAEPLNCWLRELALVVIWREYHSGIAAFKPLAAIAIDAFGGA